MSGNPSLLHLCVVTLALACPAMAAMARPARGPALLVALGSSPQLLRVSGGGC
jgi:hypothetical protein